MRPKKEEEGQTASPAEPRNIFFDFIFVPPFGTSFTTGPSEQLSKGSSNMAKTRDSKAEEEEEQGKDDMDYAGAADSFAAKQADPEDSSSSSSDEQSIESEGHEGRQPEEQEGSEEIDNNGDDSSEEDEEDPASEQFEQPTSSTGEPCTFDLRNLLAVNAHQINTKMLYSTAKGENESVTIPSIQILENIMVDEEQLIEKATDGCTQLIAGLWQLPTERSSVGTMVHLPSFDDTRIPRALVSFCSCYALLTAILRVAHNLSFVF